MPSAQFENQENQTLEMPSQEFQNNNIELLEYNKKAIRRISYSHFVELIKIKDPTQRQFYELLILKTQRLILN